MEMQRDMIVLKESGFSVGPDFEVSSSDDKLVARYQTSPDDAPPNVICTP